MDDLRAGQVFVNGSLDGMALERAKRLAAAIDAPRTDIIAESEVDKLQQALPWRQLPRLGQDGVDLSERVVFLDRMRWERPDSAFPGYS